VGIPRGRSRAEGEIVIVLYDEVYSPTCGKIRKLLEFKGLAYRTIPVPYHDKISLLAETGQDYVPFLRDGRRGVPWTETVDYLEAKQPTPSAYPHGLRAACKVLESWEYDWFEDRFWALVAPFLERTLADPIERWNFTETWEHAYGPFEATRKDPRPVWVGLRPTLEMLERGLSDHPFLIAPEPTAFDFAIYGDFQAADYAKVRWPARYPKLQAWYRRVGRLGRR
jgi:glutathione S-transferase